MLPVTGDGAGPPGRRAGAVSKRIRAGLLIEQHRGEGSHESRAATARPSGSRPARSRRRRGAPCGRASGENCFSRRRRAGQPQRSIPCSIPASISTSRPATSRTRRKGRTARAGPRGRQPGPAEGRGCPSPTGGLGGAPRPWRARPRNRPRRRGGPGSRSHRSRPPPHRRDATSSITPATRIS